jgi:hypothetical protein
VDLVVTLNGENTSAKKADTFRAYGTWGWRRVTRTVQLRWPCA